MEVKKVIRIKKVNKIFVIAAILAISLSASAVTQHFDLGVNVNYNSASAVTQHFDLGVNVDNNNTSNGNDSNGGGWFTDGNGISIWILVGFMGFAVIAMVMIVYAGKRR